MTDRAHLVFLPLFLHYVCHYLEFQMFFPSRMIIKSWKTQKGQVPLRSVCATQLRGVTGSPHSSGTRAGWTSFINDGTGMQFASYQVGLLALEI